jgi:hypothetical protein
MLLIFSCTSILRSAEISGHIQTKSNNQLSSSVARIFVGEPDFKDNLKLANVPGFLIAALDAAKNKRMVRTDKNGKFLIKNIPINKNLIIGIEFHDSVHFKEIILTDNKMLKFNYVIDLDVESIDLKINIQNNTGVTYKSNYAGLTYLIYQGPEGQMFLGNTGDNGLTKFSNVPLGLYKLYVFNETDDGPDRVDSTSVNVIKRDDDSPLIKIMK